MIYIFYGRNFKYFLKKYMTPLFTFCNNFCACQGSRASSKSSRWMRLLSRQRFMRKTANNHHRRGNNFRDAITAASGNMHVKQHVFLNAMRYLCCSSTTRLSNCTRAEIMALIWTSKPPSTSSRRSSRASTKVRGECRPHNPHQ